MRQGPGVEGEKQKWKEGKGLKCNVGVHQPLAVVNTLTMH